MCYITCFRSISQDVLPSSCACCCHCALLHIFASQRRCVHTDLQLVYDDEEEGAEGARHSAWLEEKLEEKRAGKQTYVTGQPQLKGAFVN